MTCRILALLAFVALSACGPSLEEMEQMRAETLELHLRQEAFVAECAEQIVLQVSDAATRHHEHLQTCRWRLEHDESGIHDQIAVLCPRGGRSCGTWTQRVQ